MSKDPDLLHRRFSFYRLQLTVFLVVLGSAFVPAPLFASDSSRDTVRSYDPKSPRAAYMSSNVRRHVQRFNLPVGTAVVGIVVELAGPPTTRLALSRSMEVKEAQLLPTFANRLQVP